ncbi:MAG: RnfABCDGE type electron transport complex subunit D [Acholeplasmataceae bacterium]|jgi:Na+-transporting NADH:ubiquinone oxidoreductase subunit B/electron transport complex protein RnfD|nr:RnfABCDGE type electron transport complex subunit D [Acholeplasmataceae bacterium]
MTQVHSSSQVNVPSLKKVLILTAAAFLLIVAGAIIFGIHVLYLAVVSYVVAFIVEYLFARFRKKPLDFAWMVTPALFTLLLPPAFPLWMAAVGIAFGVFFGKAIFGGSGKYIFNPALVGALFLIVNFPIQMTQEWISPIGSDIEAGPTPLNALNRGIDSDFSLVDLLLGQSSGTIGEVFRLGIIILGILLIIFKVINWKIPVIFVSTVFIVYFLGGLVDDSIYGDPLRGIMTGGLMLGAFFFATDTSTAPKTNKGLIIYGIGLGLLTVLIRIYATFPEGVTFAIILMSAISPLLDGEEKVEQTSEVHINE